MPRREYDLMIEDEEALEDIVQALNTSVRRKIMAILRDSSYSIADLAKKLDMPISTVSFHVNILRKAGFVHVTVKKHSRGKAKLISRQIDRFSLDFREAQNEEKVHQICMEIPIGSFTDAKIAPGCGIASERGIIIADDLPSVFYSPMRLSAEMVWFSKGYLEYRIPNYMLKGKNVKTVMLSMEICSEAPNYCADWESDITFWLNGEEITTYLSPGDYGDHRGRLNPEWWSNHSTQYGVMKTIKITNDGSYLDEVAVNTHTIEKLGLLEGDYITFRIGIKEDARHQGGLNLFGTKFGDFAQGLLYTVEYTV